MKAPAAMIKLLQKEGVDRVFCFPNNPLIEAAACENVRPIIGRVERGVINMADGFTRMSNGRSTGVCLVQYGPGIENAFGGVAQAYADSVPILIIPSSHGRSRRGLPTEFDAVATYRNVTKWVDTIDDARRLPELVRRAFTQLRSGRPGPVMLEFPSDLVNDDVDDTQLESYKPVAGHRSAGDPQDVAEGVRALLAAKSPVLHIGQGVLWSEASPELREFAELVQVPVMTTTLGKSAFPEDHPLALGAGGTTVSGPVATFLRKADLIFSIGASLSTTLASTAIPAGKTMIQCTIDEQDLNAEYALDHAIIGDAKLVLQQLIAEAKHRLGESARPGGSTVAQEIQAARDEWLQGWMPLLTSNEMPLSPYRVFWDLNQAVDRSRAVVTHDSGNVRDQLVPFYRPVEPRGYLGWGNSTPLGYSLGGIIGASAANQGKICINVLGDTAVGMCGMDFETAARERIPVLTLLINNGAMGGYEKYLPVATERYRTKHLSGNYVGVAESLGFSCERVERPEDIIPAIQRGVQVVESGKPALVEFITREEYAFSRLGGTSSQ